MCDGLYNVQADQTVEKSPEISKEGRLRPGEAAVLPVNQVDIANYRGENYQMNFSIAIAGKGGTGKTTLSGLLVRCLRDRGLGPILAVDADPNVNLNYVLGTEVTETVADVREDVTVKRGDLPAGMSKPEYINFKIHNSVIESNGYDLLVMGRPEGRGCYCFANDVLRRAIDTLGDNYPYMVMDEEAGMEHLSRRTTRDVNVLLMCADPSLRSLVAAARIRDMTDELELNISRKYLVVSRLANGLPESMSREIERLGLELIGTVPYDDQVSEHELSGKPLLELPDDSAAVRAVCEIADKLEIPRFTGAVK